MQKSNNPLDALTSALSQAEEIESLLLNLASTKADDLETIANSQEYLDFLGTIIYSLNCSVHSYAHIKSIPVPD